MRKVVILLKTLSAWECGLGDEVPRSKGCLQCLAVKLRADSCYFGKVKVQKRLAIFI